MAYSSIDSEARRKSIEILREKFGILAKRILEGKKPVIIMPKRVLSNTIYDERNKLLLLGPEMQRRSFLDINEARRFMQTLLMASIIYDALVNNEYPTIRDLYYRGKHTITYRDQYGRIHHENTWDEQRESDSVIRDLEVFLGVLREEMLILSKEKGKVVGNLVIRSGNDTIDLSRMGHGAYSIEPTPDFIEFKDVDAEYVLVVEKDAVFQQLHRYGFWRKHKAILITSAGQPDRATRRFVRRLNEELKLPVYILADSIPADEVVIVRDPYTKTVKIGPVEELVGEYFTGLDKERIIIPLEVLSWNPRTGKITWSRVGYIYRHRIKEKILRIKTRGRGIIRVTKAHSLFVFRDGEIRVLPAKEIHPGDYIIVAERLPTLANPIASTIATMDPPLKYSAIPKPHNTVALHINNHSEDEPAPSSSKLIISNKIRLDEDLAWLIGIYIVRGNTWRNQYLVFNLSIKERDKAGKIARILREKFGVDSKMITNGNEIRIMINSKTLFLIFKELGLLGRDRDKRIPSIIINSPQNILLACIKGIIDGGSSIDEYGNINYSTKNPILARQIFLILQSLGINPILIQNRDENIIRISIGDPRIPREIYSYITGERSVNKHIYSAEPIYDFPINEEFGKELAKLMNKEASLYLSENKTISKEKLGNLLSKGLIPSIKDYPILANGDVVVVKVLSVEEEPYEGYVYDFAVPGNNSFIGGYGIVYHNSDPYGWYIYSVFKIGSITLSYESERLATPNAKFIGVTMTDVFGDEPFREKIKDLRDAKILSAREARKLLGKKPYLSEKERRNYVIKAKLKDVERAVELVGYDVAEACLENKDLKLKIRRKKEGLTGYPWFRTPEWIRELCIFFKTLSKLEIEAMASKGLKFLADKYIPEKISTGDWID
jgi:DNA topoisomerase VI subunit A/intein/homing endonuclease